MRRWYDADLDRQPLEKRIIAVFGYGAQGRAQARNLRDAGLQVRVALRQGSASRARAEADGLTVLDPDTAAEQADIAVLLVPDTAQPRLYEDVLARHLKPGAALLFAHGYAIHHGHLRARDDLDVIMVAPLGIGEQVRATFEKGAGVPALVAVHQDGSGQAWPLVLAYAGAGGHGRAGVMETTFAEETETDLFAEQAVLVGGLSELIRAAFDTLVEAGYQPEVAYFCCLHEVKLIADMIHERGIAGMRESISEVADLGAVQQGPRIIGAASREAMRKALAEVRSGEFDRQLQREQAAGFPTLKAHRHQAKDDLIETVGKRLRDRMPWMRASDDEEGGHGA
ncbi:ketol-acid reductoisomerase [Natronospira bacteriovora]|uniref:Ketol-acid reductoisomerase (NADP(+)) n=1 Tax=Natronospira bacteriovora TaxID=3069753 RepID=A0ABU0W5Y7_9GAMM|nr:ketol-acid reductoisomerase [Natronospira sp. AB-CW4]MDQ2069438.1 ketol-acid reductoisomerase [Natronospira sp. AB-CW4]